MIIFPWKSMVCNDIISATEILNLETSPSIIIIKSRMIRRVGHVARMGRLVMGKTEG
jgi:hypothetical protein